MEILDDNLAKKENSKKVDLEKFSLLLLLGGVSYAFTLILVAAGIVVFIFNSSPPITKIVAFIITFIFYFTGYSYAFESILKRNLTYCLLLGGAWAVAYYFAYLVLGINLHLLTFPFSSILIGTALGGIMYFILNKTQK